MDFDALYNTHRLWSGHEKHFLPLQWKSNNIQVEIMLGTL